jgi:hypothetical protein
MIYPLLAAVKRRSLTPSIKFKSKETFFLSDTLLVRPSLGYLSAQNKRDRMKIKICFE